MKINIVLCISAAFLLMACEYHVNTGTTVYEDGSIDRVIMVPREKDESKGIEKILFDIDSLDVWERNLIPVPEEWMAGKKKEVGDTGSDSMDTATRETIAPDGAHTDYATVFKRHFKSVDELNMSMNSDSAFLHIESRFDKKFRWFYTYLVYSDTYKTVNRFKRVSLSDYFTKEDYAFIQRLPAESAKISKADSLYLDQLNAKFSDQYLAHAYFEDFYFGLESILKAQAPRTPMLDSLHRHKDELFRELQDKDLNEKATIGALDSIGISLSGDLRREFDKLLKQHEYKAAGIFLAIMGKYTHYIRMPWTVVDSNADSAAGNTLFWKPTIVKFLVTDYTMRAESRKLNYWAVFVSALFVAGAGVFLFRRRGLS